jgi:hypothetical protein
MQDPPAVIKLKARRAHAPTHIDYTSSSVLPKLAWLATLDLARGRLGVLHGSAVECRPQWLTEGVWDAAFEAGEFHRGAHLFGTGIRLDRGAVYFMPSCALVDRLVYCRHGDELLVSNSLVALLAATGAQLDPHHDYLIEAKAMLDGVDDYDSSFHVLHPSIERFQQIYHKAIVVRDGVVALERTIGVRDFKSFDEYVCMLRERLAALCANAADPARRTPLAQFGTLSSGYDSSAVTALVRELGVRRFFTYEGAWDVQAKGKPEYQTAAIAAALNVEALPLEIPAEPRAADELLLRAGSPLGQQAPLLAMARHIEDHAPAAVVFTGFHGGVVWGLNVGDDALSAGIKRRDMSGLDLSELRLKTGFINVAVPFLYAASIKSIVAISHSAQMTPWKLGTSYDRPISRRIVESAGVPRDSFGRLKGGILGGGMRPANPELRERYLDYVSRNLLPLPLLYARIGVDRGVLRALSRAAAIAKRRLRSSALEALLLKPVWKLQEGYSLYGRANYRGTLYVWAVMELVRQLQQRGMAAPRSAARDVPARAVRSTSAVN